LHEEWLMIRRLALTCAIASFLCLNVSGASFVHGPYTGAPTETRVTVSWSTDSPVTGWVEFAPFDEYAASGSFSHTSAIAVATPGKTSHVVLGDLEADTAYAYRVVLSSADDALRSAVGRFRTAPPPGSSVAFAVLSDTQRSAQTPARMERVGDAIAAGEPIDFVLHAGDLVDSTGLSDWDEWFRALGAMLLEAPFLPVLGNHERGDATYHEAFVLPPGGGEEGEEWWALHWGDVVIVGLDSNVRSLDDLAAQRSWVREELSGPEPHKLVIFHHALFSSSDYYNENHAFRTSLHPVFVECGVDVVFTGHVHNYERVVVDGVTYLVLGGGGATLHPLLDARVAGSVASEDRALFYAFVTASPDGIAVEVRAVAELVDSEGAEGVARSNRILDRFFLPATTAEP
jgi:predicted phosphodiesterase